MDRLFGIASSHLLMLGLRLLGVSLLEVGIITAATGTSFGSWMPLYWFLLAFAAFFGVICAQLLRVMLLMEAKKAS